jgi:hypothetical protein
MQAFAALSLLLITAVTLTVGVRLLLVARRTRRLPEFVFGVAFLAGGLGSGGGQLGQRLVWSQADAFAAVMNAGFYSLMVLGTVALYIAVWRIFRPDRRRAALGCGLGSAIAVLSIALRFASGDFPGARLETPGMLIFWIDRLALFVWTAFEALHYHGLLRRRLALGLADPVAANQILLWGIAALSMLGITATIATSAFLLHQHPLNLPVATAMITVLALGTSFTMWCAFFPPAALRRAVHARAPQMG